MAWEGTPSSRAPSATAIGSAPRPSRGGAQNVPPRPGAASATGTTWRSRPLRPPRARMLSFTMAGRSPGPQGPAARSVHRVCAAAGADGGDAAPAVPADAGVPGLGAAPAASVPAAARTASNPEEVEGMRMEQVKAELERWGELIVTLASGRKFELHLGDTEFDLQNRVIRITGPAAHFVLDGDAIEHVEMHFSHPME